VVKRTGTSTGTTTFGCGCTYKGKTRTGISPQFTQNFRFLTIKL